MSAPPPPEVCEPPPPYAPAMGYPPAGDEKGCPPPAQPPYPSGPPAGMPMPQPASQPMSPPQYPQSTTSGPFPQQAGYPPPPPPQGPYPAAPAPPVTVTVVQGGGFVLRDAPIQVNCPNCHSNVTTRVEYESGTCTYLACLALCLFGCDAGCCFIPFCMDSTKDMHHRCPNCSHHIGSSTRL